jgi:hypothetical protein
MTRRLRDAILRAGLDDWVPFAAVEGFARQLGATSDAEAIALGLEATRQLAEEGLVQLGEVSDGGFVAWGEPLDAATARIEAAWANPDQHQRGFTGWLANTPQGDELARARTADEHRDGSRPTAPDDEGSAPKRGGEGAIDMSPRAWTEVASEVLAGNLASLKCPVCALALDVEWLPFDDGMGGEFRIRCRNCGAETFVLKRTAKKENR